jgi:hypothetical protein
VHTPPSVPAVNPDGGKAALAAGLEAEIALLRNAWEHWVARRSRTTVGLSAPPLPAIGRYIGDWLCGREPPSPRERFSFILMLRFAVDDLKAYYLEAAAGAGSPSSQQLGDWFWNQTAAGAAIIALREAGLASADPRVKLIASNFWCRTSAYRAPHGNSGESSPRDLW